MKQTLKLQNEQSYKYVNFISVEDFLKSPVTSIKKPASYPLQKQLTP